MAENTSGSSGASALPDSNVSSADSDRADPSESDDTSNMSPNSPSTGSGPTPHSDTTASNVERVDAVQQCFEEHGYKVKIPPGQHVMKNGQKCVEISNGTNFHIELFNCNDFRCDVDIGMAKLMTGNTATLSESDFKDVGGWRLDPNQENFPIRNSGYGEGKFVFYSSDPGRKQDEENQKNKENLKSVLRIQFTPDAYKVHYKIRGSGDGKAPNVRIMKRSDARLEEVLTRLEKKMNRKFDGYCFFDGNKIHARDELIQTVVNHQSEAKPLLLLRETEEISVKLSDGERKNIKVKSSSFDLEDVKRQLVNFYGAGKYQLKIGDEDITTDNWFKCLNAAEVKVVKTPEVSTASETPIGENETRGGFRGIGLTRGINFGNQSGLRGFRGGGFRGGLGDDDDDDDDVMGLGEPRSSNYRGNYRSMPGTGVVRYEGEPVQGFETVISDPNAPFIPSFEDKVVMIIHLVPSTS